MSSGPAQPLASRSSSEIASPFGASCSTLWSWLRSIKLASVPKSMPESNPLSASLSLLRMIVSLIRGFNTPLLFCFMGITFSCMFGLGSKMSFRVSSFSEASTFLSRLLRSSTLTISVPCSTKMERGCWKMLLLLSSVSTVCRPAVTLTSVLSLVLVVVHCTSCTSIIISKSSNLSVPVARIHFLMQPQSRSLNFIHREMPHMAQMAIRELPSIKQQPSPGRPKPRPRRTKPIMQTRNGKGGTPGDGNARAFLGPIA
mmetsp:Transcript_60508/g.182929  ORF Transcript_60508/g.182929 Transcript_60508/m.182929 type:complete len:257 (-) Transcript_60508:7-777(-)